VGVRTYEIVDGGAVQIVRAYTEIALELVEAAIDVDAGIGRIVALPDGDRRTPVPVTTDRPVARPFQPLAERTVADVLGHPGDLPVQRQHAVLDRGDLDEPARYGLVDERRVGAPAVRITVHVAVVADDDASLLEIMQDVAVGLEDLRTGVVGDLRRETAALVDGNDERDARGFAHPLIVLAEAGSHVHRTGAVFSGDEVALEDHERV